MGEILSNLTDLRNIMSQHGLFSTGMLLILGYFLGKLMARIHLPEITGYIIAGLILGDAALGIIHQEMSESLQIVTDVALGLIALTIGGEFSMSKLKRMGSEVVIITLAQILLTLITVTLALWIFKLSLPFAMMLGAIATATAPAATVAIVHSDRWSSRMDNSLPGTQENTHRGADDNFPGVDFPFNRYIPGISPLCTSGRYGCGHGNH